jgi:predicted RNA-binding Zn-ribbon protein involved in translation (DUF1610 family)
MKWIKYKIMAFIVGECKECKEILVEEKGWGRSYCPKCGAKFHHL